jgi:hypothetical protein
MMLARTRSKPAQTEPPFPGAFQNACSRDLSSTHHVRYASEASTAQTANFRT